MGYITESRVILVSLPCIPLRMITEQRERSNDITINHVYIRYLVKFTTRRRDIAFAIFTNPSGIQNSSIATHLLHFASDSGLLLLWFQMLRCHVARSGCSKPDSDTSACTADIPNCDISKKTIQSSKSSASS